MEYKSAWEIIDMPEKFRCEVLDELTGDPEHTQFRKEDVVSQGRESQPSGQNSGSQIEIGQGSVDFEEISPIMMSWISTCRDSFCGKRIGLDFTDDYRDVIGIMSRRIMAKDADEDIDSNMLDQLFCDFVQEVIDQYGITVKHGDYVEYCNVETVYYDNAETVLGNSIRNAVEKRFPWISVRKAKKAAIIDRIRCTVRLMGSGRFWITKDCKSLETALSDAVWNADVKDKDERLDDGSTDIDSLDAFEYTIERDMKDLIEEVEDV